MRESEVASIPPTVQIQVPRSDPLLPRSDRDCSAAALWAAEVGGSEEEHAVRTAGTTWSSKTSSACCHSTAASCVGASSMMVNEANSSTYSKRKKVIIVVVVGGGTFDRTSAASTAMDGPRHYGWGGTSQKKMSENKKRDDVCWLCLRIAGFQCSGSIEDCYG